MQLYNYENHVIDQPLLPFIYHHCYTVSCSSDPPNWHQNIELLYCIGGSGFIKCGMESTAFTPGEIFVVNADTPHIVGSDDHVVYRCLIIDNSFCIANGIPITHLTFQSSIHDSQLIQAFNQVSEAYSETAKDNIWSIANIRYAVLGLLRILCQKYATYSQRDSRSDEYVKKVIGYIRQHFSENISLEDLSAYAGVSKFHLSRKFKVYTGNTIIDTVNLIRCTEARRLIEGGMTVSKAANLCGYENLSYFTRTFKKFFDALPSAYLPNRPYDATK